MRSGNTPVRHRRGSIRIRIAVIIMAAALGTSGEADGTVTGRLKGTIRDGSGKNLAGIPVRLFALGGNKKIIFVTHSDTQGGYRFESLNAGTYQMEVGGESFEPQRKESIIVHPPFRNVIDFSMLPLPLPGGGKRIARTAAADPPGPTRTGNEAGRQVGGQLRDRHGNGIADARVYLRGSFRIYRTITAPDGTFLVEKVPPGPYRLEVHSPGYLSMFLPPIEVDGKIDMEFQLTMIPYPLDFKEKIEDLLPPEIPLPPSR